MRSYRVSHDATQQIRRGLFVFSKRSNRDCAMMLAYMGEFDERKLYRPGAYSSMHQFCVGAMGMSEDSAEKRIRVARITREYPALFPAIADGRLHLSGVLLLAPALTSANAESLVQAASRKSCAQIREMLAMWFPRAEPAAQVRLTVATNAPAAAPAADAEPASKRVEELSGTPDSLTIPAESAQRAASFARFTPVAPGRYALDGRVDQALVEKLRRAQDLLSHGGHACELAQLLELAADLVLAQQRANDAAEELVPGLMGLGYCQSEARARARHANLDPDLPIEQRMLALIRTHGPRGVTRTPTPGGAVTSSRG